ncbi:MAG: CRISPR-associated endonuclease Cas3'' [Candidatus Omnitrophica bacterium]|nr:CRISPR-associated endonuclease Cas3'' [Candidatus Omnitrophota bacterium]
MAYYAHSSNKAGSRWESLKEHLELVSRRASNYADVFGGGEEARLAGLWHDLGKYSDLFSERLKGNVSGLDHWSPGAVAVLVKFREKALAGALAIQGHHIGLQEGSPGGIKAACDLVKLSLPATHPLGLRLSDTSIEDLIQHYCADGLTSPVLSGNSMYGFSTPMVGAMLDCRMLFSALVDADYIETEAHFEGGSDGTKVYRPDGPLLEAGRTLEIVLRHLESLEETSRASADVRAIRKRLLEDCLQTASLPTGIFNLTAPTGAGKTLAMLALALRHAVANPRIRRIVLVVPFLSIIEQTAAVYRRLLEPHFGPHYVLEHHSLADVGKTKEGAARDHDARDDVAQVARLLAENWDAPLILTTSVQFLESLFANRPGKCRKLHRLADSIILFDEVQTLPPRIAVPSLAALSRLAERYGCTVVFSTATQPAFDHLDEKIRQYASTGWRPRMVVSDPQGLFRRSRRVRVDWQVAQGRAWGSVAEELGRDDNAQALCVVNLKRHAQKLALDLRERVGAEGLFHLSTNMCPAHREKVLLDVRSRLASGKTSPCRLVATQCVEAGVDLDFPVVWRAFGPLDSIAQAAGRCNREGRREEYGSVVVFVPDKERDGEYLYPPGGYKEAAETTRTLFEEKRLEAQKKGVALDEVLDICDPELFSRYYRLLYDLTSATALPEALEDALKRRSFVDTAEEYRLIAQESINVLVPYAGEMALFESLKQRLKTEGRLTREWLRDSRSLTVSLYRPRRGATVWNYLKPVPLGWGEISDDWFVYLNPEDYDPLLGLRPPDEVEAWMV